MCQKNPLWLYLRLKHSECSKTISSEGSDAEAFSQGRGTLNDAA